MDERDTHFDELAGRHARVFVNGYEQKMCLTADEERGYVVRCKRPLSVNPSTGKARMERVYGRVEVVLRPHPMSKS